MRFWDSIRVAESNLGFNIVGYDPQVGLRARKP
jgi:hypothetical protein